MATPALTDEEVMHAFEACREAGSVTEGADALGWKRSKMETRLVRGIERGLFSRQDLRFRPAVVREEAAKYGADPGQVSGGWAIEQWTDQDPERGKVLKRRSMRLRFDDDLAQREQTLAEFEAKLDGLKQQLPTFAPIAWKERPGGHLMTMYTFADSHLGQRSWWREGGADWDLKIAEDVCMRAMEMHMAAAPASDKALVVFAGDWRHFERYDPVTNRSQHILDPDGRTQKVGQVAIKLKVWIIRKALETHPVVYVLDEEGNHDEMSQHSDREWLKVVFAEEPRVTIVDDDALPFYRFRHGNALVLWHHGHILPFTSKDDLARYMLYASRQYRDDWARAEHVFMHFGHRHHKAKKHFHVEDASTPVEFEQHATLAGASSDSARRLLSSPRAMVSITYDDEDGEVFRFRSSPSLLRRKATDDVQRMLSGDGE